MFLIAKLLCGVELEVEAQFIGWFNLCTHLVSFFVAVPIYEADVTESNLGKLIFWLIYTQWATIFIANIILIRGIELVRKASMRSVEIFLTKNLINFRKISGV